MTAHVVREIETLDAKFEIGDGADEDDGEEKEDKEDREMLSLLGRDPRVEDTVDVVRGLLKEELLLLVLWPAVEVM